jgi:putative DNA primase/helicase
MNDLKQANRNFPNELTKRKQWMTWTLVDKKKIPNGKPNDPSTWHDFNDLKHAEKIAFVFSADDPFVGIDLDHCIDEHGDYNEVATYCLDLFKGKSYCEISQSGRGLHFIVQGKKTVGSVCKRRQVECYEDKRFWIMTGNVIEGYDEIHECQQELESFLRTYLAVDQPSAQKTSSKKQAALDVSVDPTLRKRMTSYAKKVPSVSEGERNSSGFSLAGHLWSMKGRDGQSPTFESVLEIVSEWNQRNAPPMDDSEVKAVVQSAEKSGTPRQSKPPSLATSTNTSTSRSGYQRQKIKSKEIPNHDLDADESEVWIEEPTRQTDNELASRFIDKHESGLRFVPSWKRWLSWDGKRWAIDDNSGMALRLGRCFARSLWQQFSGSMLDRIDSNDKPTDRTFKFVREGNKQRGIKAFIDLASADSRTALDLKSLNANPLLLNVQNGTLELDTGTFREHRQEDCLTQLANVTFDAAATCPRWEESLAMIFANDTELIGYVQRLLGYAITGLRSEHILPIAFGAGCNGKSFLTNVILELLGDYGYSANDGLLLGIKDAHPTEKAALYQKRFVAVSEPDQGARLKESRVKELTGEATITARRMNEDFWSFDRTHTFWMSTNHLPRITGSDEGIWRRVKLIPFEVDLRTVTTPIPDLDKILISTEGSGILNWLVRGYYQYAAFEFMEPERVKVAVDGYRKDEDELESFISEKCETGGHCRVIADDLFKVYQDWGGKMSRVLFGKRLEKKFKRDRPTAGEFRKKTIYEGIQPL